MNLEKLNVAELNAQEVQETEGGIGILATIAAGLIVSAALKSSKTGIISKQD
jgi:hypothetical protein